MGEDALCSWDDVKREINLSGHGYDFAELHAVFDGRYSLRRFDKRFEYGETRINMLVAFDGKIVNITSTERDGKTRLISARPANRKERSLYHARNPS